LYRKIRFNKVLNSTFNTQNSPKLTPHLKGREGKEGWESKEGEKRGGKEREHPPNKISRLQHWKYPFAPMAPLPLGLAAYTGLHSPIVILYNCNIQYSMLTYTPLTPMDAVINLKRVAHAPIHTHIKQGSYSHD
jgi:hypothetical protein